MHTFIFCMFFLIFFLIQIKESKIEHSTNKRLCRCSVPPSARLWAIANVTHTWIHHWTWLGSWWPWRPYDFHHFHTQQVLVSCRWRWSHPEKGHYYSDQKWLCPQVKYISWCWWYGAERLELVKKLLREMTSFRDRGKGDFWHTQNENCITVERKMACWEMARARNVCAREKQSHRTTAWQG